MTTEQLRTEIIQDIDMLLGHALLVPAEAKHLLQTQRAFWSQPDAPLERLLGYYLLQTKPLSQEN